VVLWDWVDQLKRLTRSLAPSIISEESRETVTTAILSAGRKDDGSHFLYTMPVPKL
jgi:hypothetical protein